jgi:hypothetical protein
MKFVKLFTLSALLAGVLVFNGGAVSAKTSCYQIFTWCVAGAQDTRDHCYEMCSGIIACEAVCDSNYSSTYGQCEYDYANCED